MTVELAPPGIDTAAVTDWLLARMDWLAPPLRVVPLGEKRSTRTFRIDDDEGRAVVLRRPPPGQSLDSGNDVAREHRVLNSLAAAGMRVPRPLALCEDSAVTGAPFLVMEHVDGTAITTLAAAHWLSCPARGRAGTSLARTLAALQAVDVEAAGLGDLRSSSPYAAREIRHWQRRWRGSSTRDLPEIDALAQRFGAGLPTEPGGVLVHGALHLGNALVAANGSVRALLDWEGCTVGHPLADVGLLVACWREMGSVAAGPSAMFRAPVTELQGFPTTDELVAAYASASGRDAAAAGPWVAFAYWRLAIAGEGAYRRWLNNPGNGSHGGVLARAVPRLAGLAVEAADAAEL